MKRLILALALMLLPQIAWAACANSWTVKDGAGASQTFCRGTDGGTNLISYFTILDPAGTNTAGVTAGSALKVDASATTQPVSGTVTANAGTNLNTSALALDASVAALSLAQASSTSGQKGVLAQGSVTTAAPTYTTAQTSPINLTTGGGVRVDISTVAGAAAAQGQFVSLGALGAATAVDQNSGTKSAGSQRIVIATDDVAHAAWGQGATAAAPPAGAQYLGTSQSGLLAGVVTCDSYVTLHVTTATDTLVVQGVSAKTIKICGAKANFAGTATYKLQNTASTNANCSSTLTQIGPLISGVANVDQGWYNPIWGGMKNTSANGLCVTSTGTGGFDLEVWYTQGS